MTDCYLAVIPTPCLSMIPIQLLFAHYAVPLSEDMQEIFSSFLQTQLLLKIKQKAWEPTGCPLHPRLIIWLDLQIPHEME